MSNKIALFPGTFDPPTYGHVNIIERASKLCDKLYVVVANNIEKKCMFSAEERKAMLEEITKDIQNVEVVIYSGLMTRFAKERNASIMFRGVRAVGDFNYEFELAMTNKQLNPQVETLFIPTDPKFFLVRSSQIKEMAKFGADITNMVPHFIAKKIEEKINCKAN